MDARSPPSSSPVPDREHLHLHRSPSPSLTLRRNDVGSDRLSPPRDVMHTYVAALNGRPSPASSSRSSPAPPLMGTEGGGFAADATRPAVSDGLVDRFLSLHVGGGNGIVPAGSLDGGCAYTDIRGAVAEEVVLGARGRSIGPRPALLDDRRFAASPLLNDCDRFYGAVEEELNAGPARRRSAFEEYVLLSTIAPRQCATSSERRLAPQRATDGPPVPNADGFFAYRQSALHNEHETSFRNSCCREIQESNGMTSYFDFLQGKQRRIDHGNRMCLLNAHASIQARLPDLHCDLPVSNEQGSARCDWKYQSLASARNTRNSELYGDSHILRENTLNSAQAMPHVLRSGLPVYNQQNNGRGDWGLRSLTSARNMYGCGDSLYFNGNSENTLHCDLPVSNSQQNFHFDPEVELLASTRNMRNSKQFGCEDTFMMNRKPLWFSSRGRQAQQREKRWPQHDKRVCTRPGHNSIGQLHSPDNYSLSSPSLNLNNESIYNLAKEQNGCMCLQRMLDKGSSEIIDRIYNGIIHHVVDLMMDPSGNFLMQRLLETCNEDQRLGIILIVTENPVQLVNISLNPHGTRVVQKLIDTLETQQQIELVVSALKPGFLELINDLNGSHVVQRCLASLPPEHKKFIFDGAVEHIVDIATHRHGCCALQHCIDLSSEEYRENLVAQISANAYLLAIDAFGNYVVQYVLVHETPLAIANVLSQFKGHYATLSTQKFSSNVVEKCFKVFGEEDRADIVYELLSVPRFDQLLQDPFANYVIKTALENTKGSAYAALVEAIRPHAPALRTSPHCRKIFSLIKK